MYKTRDEELRATISIDEAIRRIKEYGGEYDPELPDFDVYDQLQACEAIDESSPVRDYRTEQERTRESTSVNRSVNDSYKRRVGLKLNENQLSVIDELKTCTYKTSPFEVSELLEKLFYEYPSKPDHWLYIAQHWTPRAICRTITRLIKLQSSGRITLNNPSAYFTFLIKKRKQRRGL